MPSSFTTGKIIGQTVTAYAWTGTANASPSTKSVNGVVQRTNYLLNPSLETGTNGWAARSGATIVQTNAEAYSGSGSMAVITNGAGSAGVGYLMSGIPAGVDQVGSVYVKAPLGFAFRLRMSNNLDTVPSLAAVGTGSWQRLTLTMPAANATSGPSLIIDVAAAHTSTTIYVDAAMLELNTLGDYFDGSSPRSTVNIYETSTPLVVSRYEAAREIRNVFNPVLGTSAVVAVAFPAGLRKGTLTAVFATRADALVLDRALSGTSVLTYVDPDDSTAGMTFLAADTLRVYPGDEPVLLGDGTQTVLYFVEFGYQEVVV